VHHPAPTIACVGEQAESAEVDLHLRTRLAVGHRHRGLAPTKVQFGCGVTVQRSIRHHHTPAAQQHVDLGQRQPLLEPLLDLFMLTVDGLPGLTLAGRPARTRPGDHRPDQLISELARTAIAVHTARPCPVDIASHRLAIGARQSGHFPQPQPLQPQPQHLHDLDH
jgi:hypothetical protein